MTAYWKNLKVKTHNVGGTQNSINIVVTNDNGIFNGFKKGD